MDGRKRRTGATRSPHDEGGQHQRRYLDPARLGSRLPPASPHRLRHEGTVPFVPTDGREALQGRHPRRSPRSGRRSGQPSVPARILQKDGSWSRTPCHSTGLCPADEERGSPEDLFGMNVTVESKLMRKDQVTQAFIPREVRDLIREKNRLRRQWQRTLNLASKTEWQDEPRSRWGDFMVRTSETPSEFWRVVRVLKGQRVPVPPIQGARGVAFTTEDTAEAFAETLERQCSPVYEYVDVDRIGRNHRQVRGLLPAEEDDEELIRPTSPEEVKAIVKSFWPTKASGPDGVTYRALKHAPKKFVMHMTNICNAMLRLRHFPSQWKLADVAMIPKPGQSHNWPQNCRPISLLPVMNKIADRIILARLREETDDLDVIPGCQFGFRREHSTTHQVLRLIEHIKEGFNRRECTGAVFLDVAKAFDKVWHQCLLWKMHRAGISKAMVKLPLLSPQEDLPSQAGRTAVHHKDGHSRRAAKVSDLTPAVQHLHQRHPDNRAH
ncbi:hypothetical protein Trydic_g4581 [Trypoxylus dichotomus]